jgi:hypothetical protein
VFQQSIKLPLQQLGLVLFGVIKRQNVHWVNDVFASLVEHTNKFPKQVLGLTAKTGLAKDVTTIDVVHCLN